MNVSKNNKSSVRSNASPANDSHKLRKWGRFVLGGLALVSMAVLVWGIRRWTLPANLEWPITVAPIITYSVGVLNFSEIIVDDECDGKANLLSLYAIFLTLLVCIMLSVAPGGWQMHLILMIFLFAVFNSWDYLIIKLAEIPESVKHEIENGHKYVNLPSFIALILAYIVVVTLAETDALIYELAYWVKVKQDFINPPSGSLHLTRADTFVSGVIAFHLLLAATVYVIVVNRTDVRSSR